MRLTKKERDFIHTARVARLATVNEKGVPHNVAICPLFDRSKIYFGSAADARKVSNITTNPNVALAFDDYTEAWAHLRGIMIQGRARVVDRRRFLALRKKIYAKYLQYPVDAPLAASSAAIIEVVPERKFSWGLK
jgi:nitroimidazol reductase NimA-like FMN-containing flavoprotein (pyridoxamine 5'-phosphate oxidase superfamily)